MDLDCMRDLLFFSHVQCLFIAHSFMLCTLIFMLKYNINPRFADYGSSNYLGPIYEM